VLVVTGNNVNVQIEPSSPAGSSASREPPIGKLVGVDLSRLQREIEKSRDGLLARTNQTRNFFGSCCTAG
jgi:hypothetical protein